MTNTTAAQAMERYAAGDEAAFAELYDLLAPRLYRYLLRRTHNPALAEDLLQQTLLHVHRARGSFLPGAEVLPWVLAIARRLSIDARRSTLRETGLTDDVPEPASGGARADEQVQARQLVSHLEHALTRLPEPQRVAFELLKRQGLSLSEIARLLKITVGAVKLRIHRAQRALRAVILHLEEVP